MESRRFFSPFFLSTFADVAVDWLETPTSHIFKADLPGISKKDVEVQIHEGNILEVSGEHKPKIDSATKDDDMTVHHLVERPIGRFIRRFQLPEDVKIEDMKAHLEDGVLTITIPKKPPAKPRTRKIPIISRL